MYKGGLSKAHSKVSRAFVTETHANLVKEKGGEIPGDAMGEEVPVNHETNQVLSEMAETRARRSDEEIQMKQRMAEEKEKQARIEIELAKKKKEAEEKKEEERKKPREVTMETVPDNAILAPPEDNSKPDKEKVAEEMEIENKYPQAEPSLKGKRLYYTQVMEAKSVNMPKKSGKVKRGLS